ncbi:hypothetical protein MNBD_ALPHA02-29 [hydrothermal vent metagenome]|uniref:Ice-binding protein C-terminal domain-containing protein n=1 Tax=hydrothermal vent metagenome TaxID=652676 RepID=A0A3B0SYC3_9ZZZZ
MKNIFQKKLIVLSAIIGLSFVSLATQNAAAIPVPAWTTINGNGVQSFQNWSFGQRFTVGTQNITVTSLGAYDYLGDGFSNNFGIPVGIFRESDGALLTNKNVLETDTLEGNFRFTDITSLMLMANTEYRVVAQTFGNLYNTAVFNWTVNPAITLGNYGYCQSSMLVKCDDITGNDIIWMANFKFTTGNMATVPEPAPLAILGLGLIGLGLARRRRS